jgi:AraC-like DNA-binding protein
MTRPTVIASLVRSIVDGAAHAGVERRALLAEVGLEGHRLDPDDRVAYATYVALWEAITARVDDDFFGLHLAESALDERAFSTVGFAARSCENFGAAIERVVVYSRLLNEATETRLVVRAHGARVVDGPRDLRRPWPRHTAECILAAYVVLGERWTGADLRPNLVCFQHARPSRVDELERVFRCPLRFSQPHNRIDFPRATLAAPMRGAQPLLREFLDRHATSQMAPLAAPIALDERVRAVVGDALPSGEPKLSLVAKRLGLSTRTLQRRLADEGLAFVDIVDEVRRALALRLVEEPAVSVREIAFLLGFSEPKAFRRAFRRWTGVAPRALRDGAQGPHAGARGPSSPPSR